MKKRGEGLPINIIIIAALGLMVLVILLYIFNGKVDIFQKSTSCSARSGSCMADEQDKSCPSEKPLGIMTDDCSFVENGESSNKRPGQCCIPIG